MTGSFGLLVLSLLLSVFLPSMQQPGNGIRSSKHSYSSQALEGRDIYASQGCTTCHTQLIRNVVTDVRVGPVTLDDTNQVIGYRRVGPDLAAIGGRVDDPAALMAVLSGQGNHPAATGLTDADLVNLVGLPARVEMSDLAAASAAMGVPEALVKRSAEARAKATGGSVDEILAAWAGGAAAPAATASAGAADSGDARRQTPDASPEPESALAGAPTGSVQQTSNLEPQTPVLEPQPSSLEPRTVTAAPPPTEVSPKEALRFPVVVTVPTSGLTERIVPAVPKWLASMLLIIPLFGLLQLAGGTSNDCGQAGELLVDRVRGTLLNCDGSPFEGRGTPGGTTDFIALGEQVFTGQVVAAANCQGCHGAQGQGVTAPALTTVKATFASCADHIEWVTKGTQGFQNEGRSTYGDLNKPVGGGGNMPSFGAVLTPEQIGAAAAFERVRFGGLAAEEVLADCGLIQAAPEAGAPGEGAPPEGAHRRERRQRELLRRRRRLPENPQFFQFLANEMVSSL